MKIMEPRPGAKLVTTSTVVDEGSIEKRVYISEATAIIMDMKETIMAVFLLTSKWRGPIST